MKTFLDEFSSSLVGYDECARKGRQVMDVAWVQSQCLEKGLDLQSQVAVAQSDIKQFYCHLVAVKVDKWMQEHGAEQATCDAFLR